MNNNVLSVKTQLLTVLNVLKDISTMLLVFVLKNVLKENMEIMTVNHVKIVMQLVLHVTNLVKKIVSLVLVIICNYTILV